MNYERITELETQIRHHLNLYAEGKPEITDAEYDVLVDTLKKLDPSNPVLFEVGAAPSGMGTVRHAVAMGSINKIIYNEGAKARQEWVDAHGGKNSLVASWKLDGNAAELVFKNSKLIEASTRGDGLVGQDITDVVRCVEDAPTSFHSTIPALMNHIVRLRGEFLITRAYFKESLEGEFENARNATAGALNNSRDPKKVTRFRLQFIPYRLMVEGEEFKSLKNEEEIVNSMKFFHGVNPLAVKFVHQIDVSEFPSVEAMFESFINERPNQEYDTDGVVVAVDNHNEREEYGYTGYNSKGVVAFKFKPEQAETTFIRMSWESGRVAKVTPVAELEPVRIGGSTITRCSLHNAAMVAKLDIAPGDTVLIEKAGDIIPQLVRVIKRKDDERAKCEPPEKCPTCGCVLTTTDCDVVCDNPNCGAKLVSGIVYYLKTIGVKGIGEAVVTTLCDRGALKSLSDIYEVSAQDILDLEGYGQTSMENFFKSLFSVEEAELAVFLSSLGIPGVGDGTGKRLAKHFKNLDDLMEFVGRPEIGEVKARLLTIEDIGDATADAIINGLNKRREIILKLAKSLKVKAVETIVGVFTGKKFCCTGTLSKPRKDFETMIVKAGGSYGSISKGLYALLVGEGAIPAKIEKAQKLGALIISEDEFNKMLM